MSRSVHVDDNDWVWTVDLGEMKSVEVERPCPEPGRVARMGMTEVIDVPNVGRMNFILASIEFPPDGQPRERLMSHGPPLA